MSQDPHSPVQLWLNDHRADYWEWRKDVSRSVRSRERDWMASGKAMAELPIADAQSQALGRARTIAVMSAYLEFGRGNSRQKARAVASIDQTNQSWVEHFKAMSEEAAVKMLDETWAETLQEHTNPIDGWMQQLRKAYACWLVARFKTAFRVL